MIEYILLLGIIVVLILLFIVYLFYPQQLMPVGEEIDIKTPESVKYHDDCLHPCVRYISEGFAGANWWMVQSPYYGMDNKLENPILYFSKDIDYPVNWEYTKVVQDTPTKGFNTDPCLFYEDNKLWVFWRECNTPRCDRECASMLTIGVYTQDGYVFSEPITFLKQIESDEDKEQCPILIKHGDKYLFYAVHYQYEPQRQLKGLVIWEGSSLVNPDFKIKNQLRAPTVYTCDKFKQLWFLNKLWFIPKPLKHNIWHFDLFEHEDKLYMVSVAEWGDNVMLAVSKDFINFKMSRIPLINNHFMETKTKRRLYFYKPSLIMIQNKIYLFYTNNFEAKNRLFLTRNDFNG
ncbi:MAG: hypothetical protein P4L28_00570 [Paludibacteraceae bacterium]|nr:hypothetical protein [Paludibacteraceae bacterium]